MNKLSGYIGCLAIVLATNPKLLEQFNAPIELEKPGLGLTDADKEKLEAAKKKRARKLERNKK